MTTEGREAAAARPTQFGRWLSIEDAAHRLGCSVATVRRRIRAGGLAARRYHGGRQVWLPAIETHHCCDEMKHNLDDEDDVLYYWEAFDEYLIPVHDTGSSGILIRYCPWCGAKLPPSRRDAVLVHEEQQEEAGQAQRSEDAAP